MARASGAINNMQPLSGGSNGRDTFFPTAISYNFADIPDKSYIKAGWIINRPDLKNLVITKA